MLETNQIYLMDNLKGIPQLPNNSIQLVVTSPPYNTSYRKSFKRGGTDYTFYDDERTEDDYVQGIASLLLVLYDKMSECGSIFFNLKNRVVDKQLVTTSWFTDIADATNYKLMGQIVWDYRGNFNKRPKGYPNNYEVIYHIVKTEDFSWYGDKARTSSVWGIPSVRGNAKERTNHPCQFPEELVAEVIHACSNEGDLVLDPYLGSGTTCAVAKKLGRRYVGFELVPTYYRIAQERLNTLF